MCCSSRRSGLRSKERYEVTGATTTSLAAVTDDLFTPRRS
jgi:hypothetical protein